MRSHYPPVVVAMFQELQKQLQAAGLKGQAAEVDDKHIQATIVSVERNRMALTRENLRRVWFRTWANDMPQGVMSDGEKAEYANDCEDAAMTSDQLAAKYNVRRTTMDRVTSGTQNPEDQEITRIERANKEAIAQADAATEAAGVALFEKRRSLTKATLETYTGPHADMRSYCDEISDMHRAFTAAECRAAGMVALKAANNNLAGMRPPQEPLTPNEVELIIPFLVSMGIWGGDADGQGITWGFLCLRDSQAIRTKSKTVEPELIPLPEQNPHEPSSSENSLYCKWDRAHFSTEGANELIPAFDAAINEICAATGLTFPHA